MALSRRPARAPPSSPKASQEALHRELLAALSMPPARKAAAPPPPLPSYAEAASRTALSLIISEAVDPGGECTRFEAIERSASEALLDVFTRFLRTLGGAARSAAQCSAHQASASASVKQFL